MDSPLQTRHLTNTVSHFKRSRLSRLLEKAIECPLVIICAGAGYGKTCAVYDFIAEQKLVTVWIQFSERENASSRAWENFVQAFEHVDKHVAQDFREFGFPDTKEKRMQFYQMYDRGLLKKQFVVVLDDVHLVKNQEVIDYMENTVHHMVSGRKSVIMISREPPQFNIAGLESKGLVANLNEEDLSFTESELAIYMTHEGLSVDAQTLREIFNDTKGWAFAVNFIAQSLKRMPNYSGYVRNAMRKNFFQLMETEVFNMVSNRLQRFLLCLSLVDHLSADLVSILAEGDRSLLDELDQQSSFVRFDSYINTYMIHHLFLDFLRTKQDMLTEEETRRTYQIAADWCSQHDFKMDALSYCEKIKDYKSIVSILSSLHIQLSREIAHYALPILDKAPLDTYKSVLSFASTHMRIVMSLGMWSEALKLMEYYETNLMLMPDCLLRNRTLGGLYYARGHLQMLLSTVNDCYDFHTFYTKMGEYLAKSPTEKNILMTSYPVGSWINLTGSPRKGSLQEFIDVLQCSEEGASRFFSGCMGGIELLARGELKYYQGDVQAAEALIVKGLARARASKQFELLHKGLFYMMQIAVSQGNFAKAEKAFKDTEALLDETEFHFRFFTYDITLGAFYIFLMQPERIPSWLMEKFVPYEHPKFNENTANQVKAQYCYITKNYAALLSFIEEQRNWMSTLYGRVELLVMEACVLFKTKKIDKAFAVLHEAYITASPNDIVMPFICFGKDMRSLASAARRKQGVDIPVQWLEMVEHKSATYAKRHSRFILDYRTTHGLDNEETLSAREIEVLDMLFNGFSRSEITASMNLSASTVKLIINNIYDKLGARSIADVIRIAAERRLV
jgi:LuxR family maltose regulon positive regulatory protein